MALPLQSPVPPMLAKLSSEMPLGDGWLYEPKWDGFRCIVFRDGADVVLGSRNERPLTRYFPELIAPLQERLPERCVLDGEIVVPAQDDHGLDFDALLQRIHPAASRVARLAAETPAAMVFFDALAVGDRVVTEETLAERRRILHSVLADPRHPLYLTPASEDPAVAQGWFDRFEGAGLDGIVAKRLDGPYTVGKRTMVKVKHERTADCAVAGYRIHKDGLGVGSLLLGLYDDDGTLNHVGVAAGFTVKQRRELLAELAPLTEDAIEGHPWQGWAEAVQQQDAGRMPGAQSRWNAGKDLSWVAMKVERVAEVTFGQLQSGRFRHGVHLVRWRPDRSPQSCTYDQLDVADPVRFDELFRPV